MIAGLDATGQVGTITDFDASAATPTAADFDGIDVAYVISDDGWADSAALGDVIADFVDGGGRVVESTFSLYCPEDSLGVVGRWVDDGYGAMVNPNPECDQRDSDGPLEAVPVVPASPLLAGVTSFNGGSSSYRNDAVIAPGAVLIANWEDEFPTPFEAYTDAHAGCVVALNFYPPSSDARARLLGRHDRRLGAPGQRPELHLHHAAASGTAADHDDAPAGADARGNADRRAAVHRLTDRPPLRRASASRRPCRTPSPGARRRRGC